ncbi:hypothetical protein GALL_545400 [mine drainage metagenome]|uniref:Uncharacterized protein n=1 Tax=mine drainage metagenome TaxID=410659 RepID=A0A1J5NXD7_9ZZZZ
MNAEHLADHDHNREAAPGVGAGHIGRNLTVGGGQQHRLADQAMVIGVDRLGLGGEGVDRIAAKRRQPQGPTREAEILGGCSLGASERDHRRRPSDCDPDSEAEADPCQSGGDMAVPAMRQDAAVVISRFRNRPSNP